MGVSVAEVRHNAANSAARRRNAICLNANSNHPTPIFVSSGEREWAAEIFRPGAA